MKRSVLLTLAALACTQQPIGSPAGDNNFDDPDDPGQTGVSSGEGGVRDAFGASCVAPRDCPAAFLCSYALPSGGPVCGATGICLPYDTMAGCDASVACGCDNTEVQLCAPAGYSPAPVQSLGPCDGGVVVNDAGADASDAPSE